MSDIRDQRRREYLWSVSCTRRCCWCLVLTVLERGPHGQPEALTATLEHPRSRMHPQGRSRLRQTRLAHYECNLTANRIEQRALAGRPQSEADLDWLGRVVALHEVEGIPAMRSAIARLVELVSTADLSPKPRQRRRQSQRAARVQSSLAWVVADRPEEGW